MASDKRWVLARVPRGTGKALDLGGGSGELHAPLAARGYEYVNLDLDPSGPGAVKGDAHDMPFPEHSFAVVVSSDSLEHFHAPVTALREVRRVLEPGGLLVVWVPFLHPFHATDYYRYTPLGLRHLLDQAGLRCVSIEAPLGLFSIWGQSLVAILQRIGLGRIERVIETVAARLDHLTRSLLRTGLGYAPFYRVVARKPEEGQP